MFRELIGTDRRDRKSNDGALQPNLLDIDVRKIYRQHVEMTHKSLCVMPQRQGRRNDKREARARLEQAKAARLMPMSPANVEKKLRHLLPFLDWCRLKGYVNRNVVDEMELQLKESRVRVQKFRRPGQKKTYIALSREELARVFGSDSFRLGAIRHDWAYWCPLLCLFAGLRIAEASQIMTCDLVCIDDVYCLRVTTTVDEKEDLDGHGQGSRQMVEAITADEAERRLKNASSRRTVPLHPKLIDLGFLEFMRNKQGADTSSLVFIRLTWHEKSQWSRKPGDHIGELLRTTKVYVKRKKVPHSLRSNLHQALKKTGLDSTQVIRLLGHATKQMADDHYGETDDGPYVTAVMVAQHLERVDFGFEVPPWTAILTLRSGSNFARL